MPSNKNRNTKDSSEKNDKPSRKDATGQRTRPASQMQRRRKGRADDDDDSVDSKGNIRDLIVSTEDEELEDDTSSFEEDTSPSEEIAPVSSIARRLGKKAPRKAAEKARAYLLRRNQSESSFELEQTRSELKELQEQMKALLSEKTRGRPKKEV